MVLLTTRVSFGLNRVSFSNFVILRILAKKSGKSQNLFKFTIKEIQNFLKKKNFGKKDKKIPQIKNTHHIRFDYHRVIYLFYYLNFIFSPYFYYFLLVLSPVLHAGRRRQASSRNDAKLRSREREREREKRRQSARSQDARFLRLFTSDFFEFSEFFSIE
jgi:hypothetical protein